MSYPMPPSTSTIIMLPDAISRPSVMRVRVCVCVCVCVYHTVIPLSLLLIPTIIILCCHHRSLSSSSSASSLCVSSSCPHPPSWPIIISSLDICSYTSGHLISSHPISWPSKHLQVAILPAPRARPCHASCMNSAPWASARRNNYSPWSTSPPLALPLAEVAWPWCTMVRSC